MDGYDIGFLIAFLAIWLILVKKVFPRYGIGG